MAWELLLSSDYGLFSLCVIVFVIVIGFGFSTFFRKKMLEDEVRRR